jgi:hypothetical protein
MIRSRGEAYLPLELRNVRLPDTESFRASFARLATPLPPLTRAERHFVLWGALFIALSRIWAASLSLWDWDEALFVAALREYDVALHQPHPPGFPLYVGLAALVNLLVRDPFRSYQFINLVGGTLLFPAAVMLGRELRFPPATAISGAFLLCFIPTVWLFGGTAFSDLSSLSIVVAACAFLLRGCRDRTSYFIGTALLALAAGFRPQAMMVGLAPGMVATWWRGRQRIGDPLLAAALGFVILAGGYGSAALLTGVDKYRTAIAAHGEYMRSVDSYQAAGRPPVRALLEPFLVHAPRSGDANWWLAGFGLIGIVAALWRRHAGMIILLASFVPMIVFALLMMDVASISRYAISYMPLHALTAAAGIWTLSSLAGTKRRHLLTTAITAVLVYAMGAYAAPAIRVVRSTISPPVQSIEHVSRHVPSDRPLYVSFGLHPHVRALLPDRRHEVVDPDESIPAGEPDSWLLIDRAVEGEGAVNWERRSRRLRYIVRPYYFAASVVSLRDRPRFRDGWYGEEGSGATIWRWMGREAALLIPPRSEPRTIELHLGIPAPLVRQSPRITARVAGEVVAQMPAPSENFVLTFTLQPSAEWSTLTLNTEATVIPRELGLIDDPRELGLRLDSFRMRDAAQQKAAQ